MGLLTIENLPGAVINVDGSTTLLAAVQAAGFDWMHACGAKGRCTTCRVRVCTGLEHFSPRTEAENRYAATGRLRADERLMCQARLPNGDATGHVPEATQLPHVRYQ